MKENQCKFCIKQANSVPEDHVAVDVCNFTYRSCFFKLSKDANQSFAGIMEFHSHRKLLNPVEFYVVKNQNYRDNNTHKKKLRYL